MGLGAALGGTELLRLLDKHAEEVSRSHQLHRAKGSREELPCHVPIFSMTFSVMTEVTKPPGFVGIISREC